MRARPRSARARTEGNKRQPQHQRSARARPAHVQREAPCPDPSESAAFARRLGGGNLDPELLEGLLGSLLFCGLLRLARADPELLAVDHRRAREPAIVRRPFHLEHRVVHGLTPAGQGFLQLRLVVHVRGQGVVDAARRMPRRSAVRSFRSRARGTTRPARLRAVRPGRCDCGRGARARPGGCRRHVWRARFRARADEQRRHSSDAKRRASGSSRGALR